MTVNGTGSALLSDKDRSREDGHSPPSHPQASTPHGRLAKRGVFSATPLPGAIWSAVAGPASCRPTPHDLRHLRNARSTTPRPLKPGQGPALAHKTLSSGGLTTSNRRQDSLHAARTNLGAARLASKTTRARTHRTNRCAQKKDRR